MKLFVLFLVISCGAAFCPTPIRISTYRPTKFVHRELSASFIDRIFRVVRANIDSIIKYFEDPEKVIEQAVKDMQTDLIRMSQSYASLSAGLQRLENQMKEEERTAARWHSRAQTLLVDGNRLLAEQALQQWKKHLNSFEALKKQSVVQSKAVEQINDSIAVMKEKISQAKLERGSLIARAKAAQSQVQVGEVLSGSGTSAVDAFERMKEQVEVLEARALHSTDLTTPVSLLGLEDKAAIDEELNKLSDSILLPKVVFPVSWVDTST